MNLHPQHGEADFSFETPEYDLRLQSAREEMTNRNIDALLITQQENLHYFSGLTYYDVEWSRYMYIWPSMLIIPRDGEPEAIVHHVFQTSARSCYPFGNVEIWAEGGLDEDPEYVQLLLDRIEKLGLDTGAIGCELGDESRMEIPFKHFKRINEKMRGVEFVNASPMISELRMIKSEAEVAYIRKACEIQDQAIAGMRERIREGMLGSSIRRIFREEVGNLGGRPIWELGSHFGGMHRSRGPEGGRDKVLKCGEIFNFDVGILYGAYHADYGRSWVVGDPSPGQVRDHERTIQTLTATLAACKPGAIASDIVKTCYAEMEVVGAPVDTTLSSSGFIGHGIGLNMAERPYISLGSREIVEPGMVLSLEPSIMSEYGWYNFEQMILITREGYELLSRAPIDFYQIPTLGV